MKDIRKYEKASSRLIAEALNVVDVSAKERVHCQAETEKMRMNLLIEKFEFSFFFIFSLVVV